MQLLAMLVLLFGCSRAWPQQKSAPVVPLPPQILTAKKAFISNAGLDAISLAAFRRAGDPNAPYNKFYLAMRTWGRWELVNTPADADLVLQLHFSAPVSDCVKLTSYQPQLELAILDTKTHFRLWTLTEPVEGAYRKATFEKNVSKGIESLIDDLKQLAAGPAAPGS